MELLDFHKFEAAMSQGSHTIGDLHDDVDLAGPCPLMVLLQHPSHTKCISFAELHADFLLQNLHCVA